MNCEEISKSIGFSCQPVNETLHFVQSPLCLEFDGSLIGAYIQDIGRDKVRITDNADILFTAVTHGVKDTPSRGKKIRSIARRNGLEISDSGELFVSCDIEFMGYYLARFTEVAHDIGILCSGMMPEPTSDFDKIILAGLKKYYSERVKRDYQTVGASGHQLTFPFVIDGGKENALHIQTIACPKGKPNWKTVYHALGKMTDLQNASFSSRRLAIIESGDVHDVRQVSTALGSAARIMVYEDQKQLQELMVA